MSGSCGISKIVSITWTAKTGHGDTRWEDIFRMLNHIGYAGPISIEWEDAGMDRLDGAPEALDFIRSMNGIRPSEASFDAAFATKE